VLPAVGEELLGTTSLFRNEVAMRGLFQSLDKFRRLTSKVLVASHSASCTGLEKAQGRAAVAAALLRRAQRLGSLNRNAFPRDVALFTPASSMLR